MACPLQSCRNIRGSKYERNNPDLRLFWDKLFTYLETNTEKQKDIFDKLFPTECEKETANQYIKKIEEDDEQNNLERDSEDTIASTDYNLGYNKKKNVVGKVNPYLKFCKKRYQKAAIWQTFPPLKLEEMTITQKAKYVTESILSVFVEWLNNLSKDSPNNYDVETLMRMFEINLDNHAARSLCVRYKELPSIPEILANSLELPEFAKRAQLRVIVQKDITAGKEKPKRYAFGYKLPKELRYQPPNTDLARNFLHCSNVPEELASMSKVWRGITHLRSTRGFCEYLLEHPDIVPPKYLKDSKMLDIHHLRAPKYSVETLKNA